MRRGVNRFVGVVLLAGLCGPSGHALGQVAVPRIAPVVPPVVAPAAAPVLPRPSPQPVSITPRLTTPTIALPTPPAVAARPVTPAVVHRPAPPVVAKPVLPYGGLQPRVTITPPAGRAPDTGIGPSRSTLSASPASLATVSAQQKTAVSGGKGGGPDSGDDGDGDDNSEEETNSDLLAWLKKLPWWVWALVVLFVLSLLGSSNR